MDNASKTAPHPPPQMQSLGSPAIARPGERADEMVTRLLSDRGIRMTRQRGIIATMLLERTGHLTVKELLHELNEVDSRISASTVYRTLWVMTEAGLAHAHEFGGEETRFESAVGRTHHDHLICTTCGVIVEFESAPIEALQQEVATAHQFMVLKHKMELYGRCTECRGAARSSKRRPRGT
jgi:Fur family transcriptional regulator, ferric uptake regulator